MTTSPIGGKVQRRKAFLLAHALGFCLVLVGTGAILAQDLGQASEKATPAPFPDFSAKRVQAPKPGSPPRITIQIEEPAPRALSQQTSSPEPEQAQAEGRYDWFWEQVPADLTTVGAIERLELALTTLRNAPTPVATPRLQLMQEIIEAQKAPILLTSAGKGVSPALVLAIIAVESAGQEAAISSAGAQGLMQLMPETASRFGVEDALAADQNIAGGIAYLDWLLQEFEGDAVLALAGYNAGEGAVRAHQGVPPFGETRDYVPKVLAAYDMARKLCMTPPLFVTDGCVFRSFR